MQELDGMNKYLQGVKLPESLAENQNKMAAGPQKGNLQQIYKDGKVDIPPPMSNASGVKTSNYEVVDDLYASMEDFEQKLASMQIKN